MNRQLREMIRDALDSVETDHIVTRQAADNLADELATELSSRFFPVEINPNFHAFVCLRCSGLVKAEKKSVHLLWHEENSDD